MTVRVVATDTETGDSTTYELEPGEYALVCVEPCRLRSTTTLSSSCVQFELDGASHTASPVEITRSMGTT